MSDKQKEAFDKLVHEANMNDPKHLRGLITQLEKEKAELVGALEECVAAINIAGMNQGAWFRSALKKAQQALQGESVSDGDWVAVPREKLKELRTLSGTPGIVIGGLIGTQNEDVNILMSKLSNISVELEELLITAAGEGE